MEFVTIGTKKSDRIFALARLLIDGLLFGRCIGFGRCHVGRGDFNDRLALRALCRLAGELLIDAEFRFAFFAL